MYYAYYLLETFEKGIVDNWDECKNICHGKKSRYKKFKTIEEAQEFLDSGAVYESKKNINEKLESKLIKEAIYFDAGTGRGKGVEVRVTDINKNSMLMFVLPKEKINEYGNYNLSFKRTNNYGELTALYFSLKIANKLNILNICGDSELVIKYWSLGRYNLTLDDDTQKLIKKVSNMRKEFEEKGGIIHKISGDVNPSDLGFHK